MKSKTVATDPLTERPRFLSEADCRDVAQRLMRYARGGGETDVWMVSRWRGTVRWARNRIVATGEDRDNRVSIVRWIQGARNVGEIKLNDVSTPALVAGTRQAERLVTLDKQRVDYDVNTRPGPFRYQPEPASTPPLFFESTYQLDASRRAEVARRLAQAATTAGMLAAGYIEVLATSYAWITSWGYVRYFQYTWAQLSTTVRDPKGIGSGWAGVDWPDWNKIDGDKLAAIALDKCLMSRGPVAIEPGRYTTILEPQAVCDFVSPWGFEEQRLGNETDGAAPFHKSGNTEPPLGHLPSGIRPGAILQDPSLGLARFGERVIDERLTVRTDPDDPDLCFPPWSKLTNFLNSAAYDTYHPVTWIENGVLKNLGEDHYFAVKELGRQTGQPTSGAFHMTVNGATASIDEMISTTKRGVLVTRFDNVVFVGTPALLCRGYTRDGLWLVENGKISKPVKNMQFVESVLFALNNVEQLGIPQRAFHPVPSGFWEWIVNPKPVVVPAIKVKDFSFTALSGSV